MMRKKLLHIALMLLLGFGLMAPLVSQQAWAANKKSSAKSEPPLRLKVGDMAPNFTLLEFTGHDLKKVSLSEFRGKKDVVLAFYVFAFTGG
jgi:cytochrome oxidase Cu insertion factor (SCO1/SenC/PrrC family)